MEFAKVTAAAALLVLAAGCGNGQPAKGPAQLKVWMMGPGSPEQTTFLDQVEQEFRTKHPSTDVRVEYVPWPQAPSKFQKAIAGGEGPDVTELGNTDAQSLIESGAFADVTDNVNKWAEGADLSKAALANDQASGRTYAVPWYGGVRGVWYRKDWFTELGIQPPKTWSELTAAAKKVQDSKKVPGIAAPSDFTNGILSFVWGAGGDVAVKEGGRWVGKLDQPQAKEGIGFYAGLVNKDQVAPAKYVGKNELQGPQQDFALGKVGMYMDGSWALPQMLKVSEKNKDTWGVFPIPGRDGGTAPVFSGGSDLAVWKDTKLKDIAFDYVTVLNSKKNAKVFADQIKFSSQHGDVTFSDPTLAVFTDIAKNAKFTPTSKGWAEFEGTKKVIPNTVKSIMQGKPIDDELRRANEQVNELLNS